MDSQRILVIEDETDIRASLVEALTDENHDVYDAKDGFEALDKLKTSTLPDLILLDLMMPGMNGWEFLNACQKIPHLAKIPVVVVSAIANGATASGATDFIQKPIDLDALLMKIEKHSFHN